jgi:hypothetical protein
MADMNYYFEIVLNKRGVYKYGGRRQKQQPFTKTSPRTTLTVSIKSIKSGMVTGFAVHKHGSVRTTSVHVIDGIINALKP